MEIIYASFGHEGQTAKEGYQTHRQNQNFFPFEKSEKCKAMFISIRLQGYLRADQYSGAKQIKDQ